MARREVRILKYTKLGLAASGLAALAALAAVVVVLKEWNPDEGIIDAGTITRPIIMLAAAGCLVCGVPGFLLSLEGAAGLEGQWRKRGWLGFWVGVVSTMLGLASGLSFFFLKV